MITTGLTNKNYTPGIDSMDKGTDFMEKGTRRKGRSYASKAAFCPRKDILGQRTNSTKMDAQRILYISLGNIIENIYQEAWEKDGTLLISNFKLPDLEDIDIGGEVDAICFMDGKLLAFELKSYGKKIASPKPPHLAQASFYSAILGLPIHILYQSREVADWYFDKGAGELKSELVRQEFIVEYERENLYHYIYNTALAEVYEKDGVLPPKNPQFRKTIECKFCPFIDVCWGNKVSSVPESNGDKDLDKRAEYIANKIFDNLNKRREEILLDVARKGTDRAREVLNYDRANNTIDLDPRTLPETL